MQVGEARGHGCLADLKTLEMMRDLGNSSPGGIRGRFGHPGISENMTGKQLQVARSFSIVNDRLVHDSFLLESARKSPAFAQDPVEWLFTVAEKHPTELGESVVIDTGLVWILDDGTEKDALDSDDGDIIARPKNATTKLPFIRPVHFHFVDFVNEGALTPNGLFEGKFFTKGASSYAEDLYRLVDEWRLHFHIPLKDIPHKVDQLLSSYLYERKYFMPTEAEVKAFEESPVPEEPTLNDILSQLETRVAQLEPKSDQPTESHVWSHLQALEEQVRRLTSVVSGQIDTIEALQRDLTVLSGERVVTERVPRQNVQPLLSSFEHRQPAPGRIPEVPGKTQPESTDPRVLAAQSQLNRNRQYQAA